MSFGFCCAAINSLAEIIFRILAHVCRNNSLFADFFRTVSFFLENNVLQYCYFKIVYIKSHHYSQETAVPKNENALHSFSKIS